MKYHDKGIRDLFGRSDISLWISIFILIFMSAISANAAALSQISGHAQPEPSLQFTSDGHVLGFGPEAIVVTGPDHLLTIAFLNAQPVTPRTAGSGSTGPSENKQHSPQAVTYPDLWPGVSLLVETGSGLMESIYHVHAINGDPSVIPRQRPVDQIQLRYNVPVSLDAAGNLILAFDNGHMRESAPIAWQEIDGRRIPVRVAFRILGRHEVGFDVAPYDLAYPLLIDPVMTWNTFLGAGTPQDYGRGIALDAAGNIYVAGYSDASWGTPVNPHQGGQDAFVAKLDRNGNLVWHTFLGSASDDWGYGAVLDAGGNLFVTGYGDAGWGVPVAGHSGSTDVFVARLNSSDGTLVWNTFMGGTDRDYSYTVLSDRTGNLYVAGRSEDGWGSPIDPHAGGMEVFVAQLSAANGNRRWHTFMGSAGTDFGYGLARDAAGNLYVGGRSDASWGLPVNGHTGSGDFDAFVTKLSHVGNRLWHTFMGSPSFDYCASVAIDGDHLYLTGHSDATWGAPINTHAGNNDAFVAKLNAGDGTVAWNTFMGSALNDQSSDMALDAGGDILVVGFSDAAWGLPDTPYAGGSDGFAAKLNADGHRLWNTFMGSGGSDLSYVLAVDTQDNIYISGRSSASWGEPVRGHSDSTVDAFVAKLGATYKLSLNLTGIGNGTVTAVPSGIDCGTDCITSYDQGTLVTLTAAPDAGSTFSSWAGIGCADTGDCTISMNADRMVRAHFNDPALDADGDGIPDRDEHGPLANDIDYDGNNDGTADWRQAEVVSSPSADGAGYVTFSASGQVSISAADTLEKPPWTDPPKEIAFDLGFFDFTVDNRMVGDTVSITFHLKDGVKPHTYYKFGPTPDNPVDHWYEFLYDGTTGAEINGNVITLHFKDGQRGDNDLDDANGIIIDPGGPGFEYNGGDGQASGGGSGCMIGAMTH